jgi:hypothetical protein
MNESVRLLELQISRSGATDLGIGLKAGESVRSAALGAGYPVRLSLANASDLTSTWSPSLVVLTTASVEGLRAVMKPDSPLQGGRAAGLPPGAGHLV